MKQLLTLALAAASVFSVSATIPLTAEPAAGTVDKLETITIKSKLAPYPKIWAPTFRVSINQNGQPVQGHTVARDLRGASANADADEVYVKVTPAITEPGNYTLTIDGQGLYLVSSDGEDDIAYAGETQDFSYTIAGSTTPADPASKYKWTLDPAPGTVNGLAQITLSYEMTDYYEVTANNASKITVLKDGEFYSNVTCRNTDDNVFFTLANPATEPGTYTLKFESGALKYMPAGQFTPSTLAETITYTYVIEGGAQGPAINLSSTPATGVVEAPLSTVTLAYSFDEYSDIHFTDDATVELLKDGQPFSAASVRTKDNYPAREGQLIFTFATPATDAGTYTLRIGASSLEVEPADSYPYVYEQELNFEYTIESAPDPASKFKWTLDPAPGTVNSLAQITLSYAMTDYFEVTGNNANKMSVLKDGQPFSTVTYRNTDDNVVFTLGTPATEPGTYTLKFESGALKYMPAGSFTPVTLAETITYTYVIEQGGAQEPAIKLTSTPAVGVVEAPLSTVTLAYSFDDYSDIQFTDDATVELLKDGQPFSAASVRTKDNYPAREGQLIFTFATPATAAGTYTLRIGAGSLEVEPADNYPYVLDQALNFDYTIEGSQVDPGSDHKWTLSPAAGSEVTKLESVTLTYSFSDYSEVFVSEPSFLHMYKDGNYFCSVAANESATQPTITFTPTTPATEPGTYTLQIGLGALSWIPANSSFPEENDQVITYDFIVIGEPAPSDYAWTVTPAPGAVVESLETISMSYSPLDYIDIDVNTLSDIGVYKDGQLFSAVTVTTDTDSDPQTITFKLKNKATEPGTYVFKVAPGALCFFGETYSEANDNEKEIAYTYTIAGDVQFAYTTTPASGATLKAPLESVKFEYFNCGEAGLAEEMTGSVVVKLGDQTVDTSCTVTNNLADFNSVLTFTKPLTEPGTYTVALPKNMLYYFTDKTFTTLRNVDVELTFTLEAPAEPVVYDMMPVSTQPADGSTLDLSEKSLTSIFINVPNDVKPAADAKITMTNGDGSYSAKAVLKFSFQGRLVAFVDEPRENGIYTITVPQGSFGDVDWQNDPATGHANPEFTVSFNVIGGRGAAYDLAYESYTPAGNETDNLAQFTITFPEGTQMAEGASATLIDATMDYRQTAAFTELTNGSVFGVTFNPAPTSMAGYRLTIPMGSFGDATYFESEGTNGHANAEITIDWTLTGIGIIEADGSESRYFNLQGQPVAYPAPGQVVIKVNSGKASKIRF